jgi:dolichyl-phosphate beta-glucosyltransferase
MLDDTLRYLHSRGSESSSFTWEIIIVDDGSRYDTIRVALGYAERNPGISLLRQPINMEKGTVIQAGCLHARGRLILLVDVDGATKNDEFGVLERKLLEQQPKNNNVIFCEIVTWMMIS